jgi:hypothetical protein
MRGLPQSFLIVFRIGGWPGPTSTMLFRRQGGACRRSRGCSVVGAADGRLVVEATMGSLAVVVVVP